MDDSPFRASDGTGRWQPGDSTPLRISVTRPDRGLVVVAPEGELDLVTGPDLEGAMEWQLRSGECLRLVVDLGHLDFLAVYGVHCLERARDLASSEGCDLRLVVNTRVVGRVLQLLGLDRTFHLHRTVDAACRANGRILPTRRGWPGMLAMTDAAAGAVRALVASQLGAVRGGVRLTLPRTPDRALQADVTTAPELGDEVVERAGAQVYLAQRVATALRHRFLDAGFRDDRIEFLITDGPRRDMP